MERVAAISPSGGPGASESGENKIDELGVISDW